MVQLKTPDRDGYSALQVTYGTRKASRLNKPDAGHFARAGVEPGSELDDLLVGLERDLYVLMAELATLPANRAKLSPGVTLVNADMVGRVEQLIDRLTERFPAVTEFVIPGGDRVAASLDVARTVVRRAERLRHSRWSAAVVIC